MRDIENKPDNEHYSFPHNDDTSDFEHMCWRMLYSKEVRCPRDDGAQMSDIEGMFDIWNERFGCNLKPRWKMGE